MRIEAAEEGTANTQGTGSGDGLGDGELKAKLSGMQAYTSNVPHTAFSKRGLLSALYASFAALLVNSGRPVIGKYSLSGFEAVKSSSAYGTTA